MSFVCTKCKLHWRWSEEICAECLENGENHCVLEDHEELDFPLHAIDCDMDEDCTCLAST